MLANIKTTLAGPAERVVRRTMWHRVPKHLMDEVKRNMDAAGTLWTGQTKGPLRTFLTSAGLTHKKANQILLERRRTRQEATPMKSRHILIEQS